LKNRKGQQVSKTDKDKKDIKPKELGIRDQIKQDRELEQLRYKQIRLNRKYEELLKTVAQVENQRDALMALKQSVTTHTIEPRLSTSHSEATAVLVASDWHIEERVKKEAVNGLNEYTLAIAENRADLFFRNGLRLTNIMSKEVTIKTIVLALLGDFITNQIHEEFPENNQLLPTEAIKKVQEMLASGIKFILANSNFDLVIPCHSGNHARTTTKTHVTSEHGHSLEYLMYHSLASVFENEKRVKFIISDSYHSFVDIFGFTVRFHHGHNVRYQGGVGGITIPANKAIAQWNQARKADLDVFGHFHQYFKGSRFICNGSMIGYNAFAVSIKAEFGPPQQAFFLIDKKRGRTIDAPILFI